MGYMSCFERVAMQANMSRDQKLLTNTHSLQLWNFTLHLHSQRVTQRLPLGRVCRVLRSQ